LKKAFSLLELSIVIAVIAVLMASFSVATNLVDNATLMQSISQIERHAKNIVVFRAKYGTYPGDYSNAYASFGSACAGDDQASCDGDGDGLLEWNSGSDEANESIKIFHHMYLADIMSEPITDSSFGAGSTDFSGASCSSAGSIVGKSTPTLEIENLTILLVDNEYFKVGNYRCGWPIFAGLTPRQAAKYDVKFDDGVRDQGLIKGVDGVDVSSNDCISATGNKYNLANSSRACYLNYHKFKGGL